MEFTTCYCPHPQCTHYGRRGDTHLVRRGVDRGIPRLLCTKCKGTFSARQGTAYFGVHAEEPNKYPPAEPEVLRLLAPQRGLAAIAKSKAKNPEDYEQQTPGTVKLWESPGRAGGLLGLNYTIAMRALAEGNSLRGTGRIVDVDNNWLRVL